MTASEFYISYIYRQFAYNGASLMMMMMMMRKIKRALSTLRVRVAAEQSIVFTLVRP